MRRPAYAEAKNMKSLTLQTHGYLRHSLIRTAFPPLVRSQRNPICQKDYLSYVGTAIQHLNNNCILYFDARVSRRIISRALLPVSASVANASSHLPPYRSTDASPDKPNAFRSSACLAAAGQRVPAAAQASIAFPASLFEQIGGHHGVGETYSPYCLDR